MNASPQARRDNRLLAKLMEVVRPEFRGEVFYPPRDSRVFFQGTCRIPSCGIALSHTARGLCAGHYQRWNSANHPNFEAWVVAEDAATRRRQQVACCAVSGCNRATRGHGLCTRHSAAWTYAGRPDLPGWLTTAAYQPPPSGEHDCVFPGCGRWADGPTRVFCRPHDQRWRDDGRPEPLQEWYQLLDRRRDPHVRLHDLGAQVRLELQYGLQRRHDQGTRFTAVRTVTKAVGWVRRSGVTSLRDWDDDQWRTVRDHSPSSTGTRSHGFIRDIRFGLHELLIADDPWADQYPRDVWDLRHLRIADEDVRHLRFAGIPQTWLQDTVKRWCRWRLARGLTAATVAMALRACTLLAVHIADTDGPDAGPQALTRERIESWLAALHIKHPSPTTRAPIIHSVGGFLKDVHRHGWVPDLPPNAFIYDDAPKRPPGKARFIPEQVMRQLESPGALAQFPSTEGRLMLEIIMACGLRLKDARWLPLDCVIRDETGNPYLAWLNRKMHDRPAFFPLAETLATKIIDHQRAVTERFPHGTPWLFPARQSNLDGSKPATDRRFREHLDTWLNRLQLTDEHGRPVRVTFHQFRHTLGTRLINADVPQPVVQALLDHMSPQMTALYARLHNETMRRHWEHAVKVNADGQPAAIASDHPLAQATWTRMSMVRAKVTLPNGYCGAPIQTDCEYANPCLDCRFFITTPDFLDQHRRQRNDTAAAIDDAQQAGLGRIVEKNTRTLAKLDTIITALESADADQIVAGGNVENLDATG